MQKFTALMTAFALGAISIFGQGLTPKKDEKKPQWGYVDASGQWSIKPKWDSAGAFESRPNGKSTAIVEAKGCKGFIDETGKPLGAGVVFSEITPLDGDAMIVTVKDKKGVMNYDGVYLIKPEMTDIQPDTAGGFLYTANGKQGYFTKAGKIVIPAKDYTSLRHLTGDYWAVGKGNKVGVYNNATGRLAVKCDYTEIVEPVITENHTYFKVKKGDNLGAVTNAGREIIECRVASMDPFGVGDFILVTWRSGGQFLWSPANGNYIYFKDKLTEGDVSGGFHVKVAVINTDNLDKKQSELINEYFPKGYIMLATDKDGNELVDFEVNKKDNYFEYRYKRPEQKDSQMTYATYLASNGDVICRDVKSGTAKAFGNWLRFGDNAYDLTGNNPGPHKFKEGRYRLNGWYYVLLDDNLYHEMNGKGEMSNRNYEDIQAFAGIGSDIPVYMKKVNGRWGAYNADNGKEITPIDPDFDLELICMPNETYKYYVFRNDNKYGIMEIDNPINGAKSASLCLPAEYDTIYPLRRESYDVLVSKDGKGWIQSTVTTDDKPKKFDNPAYDPELNLYSGRLAGKKIYVTKSGEMISGDPAVWVTSTSGHYWTGSGSYRYTIVKLSYGFKVGTRFSDGESYKIVAKLMRNGKPAGSAYEYTTYLSGSTKTYFKEDAVIFDVPDLHWSESSIGRVSCKIFVYNSKGKLVCTGEI